MIRKAPWKLGFITTITGGELESQQARQESRCRSARVSHAGSRPDEAGVLYFRQTRRTESWEAIEGVFLSLFLMACVPNTPNVN